MLIGASFDFTRASASAPAADFAASAYAADYGVSESEAKRRLDRIRPIHDVLTAIRDAELGRVAGWGIDHGEQMIGWVLLTGDSSVGATASALAGANSDIKIRTGAAYTYQQLLNAQHAFGGGASLRSAPDRSAIITYTTIDMRGNTLEIGIDPALRRDDGSNATDAELRTAIAQLRSDYSDHLDTSFTVTDGRGFADGAIFDGGRPGGNCTSGFAAQDNDSGDYGIVTAGHCSKTFAMNGVTLPWVRGYASTTADAQFHRIPGGVGHTIRSQYKRNPTPPPGVTVVDRDIARSAMMSDYVCHTGKNSGVSCGTVIRIDFRPTYDRACLDEDDGESVGCTNHFVRVRGSSLKACKGDSGGPWWKGGTAYGVLKGSNSGNDCNRTGVEAFFSTVREAEAFLDVEILENTFEEVP